MHIMNTESIQPKYKHTYKNSLTLSYDLLFYDRRIKMWQASREQPWSVKENLIFSAPHRFVSL